jgi:hypothetical protein
MAALAHLDPVADGATVDQFTSQTNSLVPSLHGAAETDQRQSQRTGSKIFAVAFLIALLGATSLWVAFILWVLWIAVPIIF